MHLFKCNSIFVIKRYDKNVKRQSTWRGLACGLQSWQYTTVVEVLHLEVMTNKNALVRSGWVSRSPWLPSSLIWSFLKVSTSNCSIKEKKLNRLTKYPPHVYSSLSAVASLFSSPALSFQALLLLPLMMCCPALWTYKFKRRILHLELWRGGSHNSGESPILTRQNDRAA